MIAAGEPSADRSANPASSATIAAATITGAPSSTRRRRQWRRIATTALRSSVSRAGRRVVGFAHDAPPLRCRPDDLRRGPAPAAARHHRFDPPAPRPPAAATCARCAAAVPLRRARPRSDTDAVHAVLSHAHQHVAGRHRRQVRFARRRIDGDDRERIPRRLPIIDRVEPGLVQRHRVRRRARPRAGSTFRTAISLPGCAPPPGASQRISRRPPERRRRIAGRMQHQTPKKWKVCRLQREVARCCIERHRRHEDASGSLLPLEQRGSAVVEARHDLGVGARRDPADIGRIARRPSGALAPPRNGAKIGCSSDVAAKDAAPVAGAIDHAVRSRRARMPAGRPVAPCGVPATLIRPPPSCTHAGERRARAHRRASAHRRAPRRPHRAASSRRVPPRCGARCGSPDRGPFRARARGRASRRHRGRRRTARITRRVDLRRHHRVEDCRRPRANRDRSPRPGALTPTGSATGSNATVTLPSARQVTSRLPLARPFTVIVTCTRRGAAKPRGHEMRPTPRAGFGAQSAPASRCTSTPVTAAVAVRLRRRVDGAKRDGRRKCQPVSAGRTRCAAGRSPPAISPPVASASLTSTSRAARMPAPKRVPPLPGCTRRPPPAPPHDRASAAARPPRLRRRQPPRPGRRAPGR